MTSTKLSDAVQRWDELDAERYRCLDIIYQYQREVAKIEAQIEPISDLVASYLAEREEGRHAIASLVASQRVDLDVEEGNN